LEGKWAMQSYRVVSVLVVEVKYFKVCIDKAETGISKIRRFAEFLYK